MGPKKRKNINGDGDNLLNGADEQYAIELAYKLLEKCSPGKCRRNCRTNPLCWNCLGEKPWLNKQTATKKKGKADILLIDGLETREAGTFAGLKNLGATCYANCPVQLLNNIPIFRKRLVQWNPSEDPHEDAAQELLDLANTTQTPKSITGSLLYVFALLYGSRRLFIDPHPFIDSLGLDVSVQQDSQEFSALLLQRLEADLHTQKNPAVRDLCQDLFRGLTRYVNECCTCGYTSPGAEEYIYSLLVNPGFEPGTTANSPPKTLIECLDNTLSDERLEGDNKYSCGNCDTKQEAFRKSELTALPQFLFFQVVRFLFDRASGTKRKQKDKIKFDNVIDLSKYLKEPEGTSVYRLFAVLHHRGPTADSGHYIAHVMDPKSSRWVKFNDDFVEYQKYPDFNDGSKGKKDSPETHVSSSCYLIVYAKDGAIQPDHLEDYPLPDWLQKFVDADDALLREGLESAKEAERREEMEQARKRKIIADAFDASAVTGSKRTTREWEGYEFVPTEWVSKWLEDKGNYKSKIEMKNFVCEHGRLMPSKVSMLKCIPREMAEEILSHYKKALRFRGDDLCRDCVLRAQKSSKTKDDIQQDAKAISQLTSNGARGNDGAFFWVGKESFKRWPKLALRNIIMNSPTMRVSNGGMNGHDEEVDEFNSEIECCHGGLSADEKIRQRVPLAAWEILVKYFTNCPTYPCTTPACELCTQELLEEEQRVNEQKKLAALLKEKIGPIFTMRRRIPACGQMLVLPMDFVKSFNQFIKFPDKNEPAKEIDFSSIVCEHNGLKVDPHVQLKKLDKIFLVKEDNVEILEEQYAIRRRIYASPPENWTGGTDLSQWHFTMPVCPDCADENSDEDDDYEDEPVYVQKFELDAAILELLDKDLDEKNYLKLDLNTYENGEQSQLGKLASIMEPEPSDGVRRSSRSRKTRDEKMIIVSSKETLADLQKKISQEFGVPASEQKLLMGPQRLIGPEKTLRELNVKPKAHLIVAYDENVFADPESAQPIVEERVVETGFKGTKLFN